jgi:hypothetical protein
MINKSTLEDLVTPYAKAPVEYPSSADPALISISSEPTFPNGVDCVTLKDSRGSTIP